MGKRLLACLPAWPSLARAPVTSSAKNALPPQASAGANTVCVLGSLGSSAAESDSALTSGAEACTGVGSNVQQG